MCLLFSFNFKVKYKSMYEVYIHVAVTERTLKYKHSFFCFVDAKTENKL